jgi:hypothetical protein
MKKFNRALPGLKRRGRGLLSGLENPRPTNQVGFSFGL